MYIFAVPKKCSFEKNHFVDSEFPLVGRLNSMVRVFFYCLAFEVPAGFG